MGPTAEKVRQLFLGHAVTFSLAEATAAYENFGTLQSDLAALGLTLTRVSSEMFNIRIKGTDVIYCTLHRTANPQNLRRLWIGPYDNGIRLDPDTI